MKKKKSEQGREIEMSFRRRVNDFKVRVKQ